ncbi:hypothetical protein [Flavobacterium sp. AED]|uniref:hypothetical protein n=1 Tax=Flavobacterium sp. AED TaxID=1423323 RepID=UPI00057D4B30|nr:hypothetical protein [Flavobacterium sp. AED]KIA84778.1 hypothetical protein OA85_13790 [Flavobacterium sp. AED]
MAGKYKKVIDIVWVEDNRQYLPSIGDELNEIQHDCDVNLDITEENDSNKFKNIAYDIPSALVFCIDYNLSNNGDGIDGNQVIKNIRSVNKTCTIIFYSFNLDQEGLRKLVDKGDTYTYCVHRPNLMYKLRDLIEEGVI